MTRVDLHLLVAGHSTQQEWLSRRHGSWRRIHFPATVAVIRGAAGMTLYDTGYSTRYLDATAPFPERLYRWVVPGSITPQESVAAQLTALGADAAEVDTVIVSHLHADHSSGLCDFPSARIIAAEAASCQAGARAHGKLVWATTAHGVLPAVLPADFAARRLDPAALAPVETGLPGLEQGHDVHGDGSTVIVALPGHSPGHLGLWLPATQGPPVLLVGDACWSRAALTGDLPPRPVLTAMHDPDAYIRTISALARLSEARPDIVIVPSHCHDSVTAARAVLG